MKAETEPRQKHPATSDDAFLGGRLHLLQPRQGYRAGIDAVFLAAAVAASGKARILEAGSGAGVASLCLAERLPDACVTGIEIEPSLVAIASENARRNGLGERARFIEADILAGAAAARLEPESFDHAIANPPYFDEARARASGNALKARAHVFAGKDLEHWLRFMTGLVRPRGSLTLVHRADALEALLAAFQGRAGALRIMPLFPRAGAPATRILVQGIKGSRAPLTLLSGLALHGNGDAFTPAAEAVLRNGEGLALG